MKESGEDRVRVSASVVISARSSVPAHEPLQTTPGPLPPSTTLNCLTRRPKLITAPTASDCEPLLKHRVDDSPHLPLPPPPYFLRCRPTQRPPSPPTPPHHYIPHLRCNFTSAAESFTPRRPHLIMGQTLSEPVVDKVRDALFSFWSVLWWAMALAATGGTGHIATAAA